MKVNPKTGEYLRLKNDFNLGHRFYMVTFDENDALTEKIYKEFKINYMTWQKASLCIRPDGELVYGVRVIFPSDDEDDENTIFDIGVDFDGKFFCIEEKSYKN